MSKHWRVLIADDDLTSLNILKMLLTRWGYEVDAVSSGQEAWDILLNRPPAIALIDWMMPDQEGLELCRRLRETRRSPYTYIILSTGNCGKEEIIQAMMAGADDVIAKPFNALELKVRVMAGHRIVELQADLIATREELRRLIAHDALTGLLNRRTLFSTLDAQFARIERNKLSCAIMMLDLDHFRLINEDYGRCAGDAVLVETAQRIQQIVRPYDCLGRFAAEEFLLMSPECSCDNAVMIAERIRVAIQQTPVQYQEWTIPVTISIGVVYTEIAKRADIEQLIFDAHMALHRAKQGGRNLVFTIDFASDSSSVPQALAEFDADLDVTISEQP